MIITYKKNGNKYYKIQLSITDRSGKRHQPKYSKTPTGESISSLRMAKKLELQYYEEEKAKAKKNYSKMKFDKFHEKFLEEIRLTMKRGTVMQYDGDLKKWLTKDLSSMSMEQINKGVIHKFIFETLFQHEATANTQKRILKALKKIFESALEEGIIARNPARGISVKTPPPKKQVLNTKEAAKLLEEAKECNHPFYHIWAFALLTGLRNGEMYALRWADLDEVTNIINVSASWSNKDGYHSTKSNKDRVVPISKDLKTLLIELKSLGPYKENLKGLNGSEIFFNDLVLPRSTEWRHGEQSKLTREFCNLIGISTVKFHDLRATFITNLLAQGVPVAKVMSIVGHSRMTTTNEYLRLAGVETKGVTEQLSYNLPIERKENVVSLFAKNSI